MTITYTCNPGDKAICMDIIPKIVKAIDCAEQCLMKGKGTAQLKRWFDNAHPGTARNSVRTELRKLKMGVNHGSIIITTPLASRINANSRFINAGANVPEASNRPGAVRGWHNAQNTTRLAEKVHTIELNVGWNRLRSSRYPRGSNFTCQFQTLTHELTHSLINTNAVWSAETYGKNPSAGLATSNPTRAFDNADNWGFFLCEFFDGPPSSTPPPVPTAWRPLQLGITHADWKSGTTRGVFKRNTTLTALDDALEAYELASNATTLTALKEAFDAWYDNNPNDRAKRNNDQRVENLKRRLDTR